MRQWRTRGCSPPAATWWTVCCRAGTEASDEPNPWYTGYESSDDDHRAVEWLDHSPQSRSGRWRTLHVHWSVCRLPLEKVFGEPDSLTSDFWQGCVRSVQGLQQALSFDDRERADWRYYFAALAILTIGQPDTVNFTSFRVFFSSNFAPDSRWSTGRSLWRWQPTKQSNSIDRSWLPWRTSWSPRPTRKTSKSSPWNKLLQWRQHRPRFSSLCST